MAIQGKLVPQDPHDEPACVLLERIREEKKRLVKEGVLKKKDLEEKPISEEEKPFDIPDSWVWCRISQVIYPPKYGTSNKSLATGSVPVLRMGNIQNGEIVFDKLVYSNNEDDNAKYNLIKGDLLFNRTNSAELVGKTGIFRGNRQAIFAGYLILLRPICINSDYLNYVLGSNYARSYCKDVKTIGVQQCNINAEKISIFVFPLPPLSEQRRIVEKLESLMPLIESYGKSQEALNALNTSLPEKFRQSILQEAIQGHLVPQDPNEEPASVLLERIRAEKARLVKEGKLKKKDLEEKPISIDEIPFDIPEGWEWCRLGDYVQLVTDFVASGSFASLRENVTYYKEENYALLVKTKDFQSNFEKDLTFTDEKGYNFLSNSNLFGGELILSNVGSIGKVFVVPKLNRKMTLAPNAIMVRLWDDSHRDWLYYLFQSEFGIASLLGISSATAISKFNKTDFKKLLIPLPPLSEQRRIVTKLEELLQEIDKLKA